MKLLEYIHAKGYAPDLNTVSVLLQKAIDAGEHAIKPKYIDVIGLARNAACPALDMAKQRPWLSLITVPMCTETGRLSAGQIEYVRALMSRVLMWQYNDYHPRGPICLTQLEVMALEEMGLPNMGIVRSQFEADVIAHAIPKTVTFSQVTKGYIGFYMPVHINQFYALYDFLIWLIDAVLRTGEGNLKNIGLQVKPEWTRFISIKVGDHAPMVRVDFDGEVSTFKGFSSIVALFVGMSSYFTFSEDL